MTVQMPRGTAEKGRGYKLFFAVNIMDDVIQVYSSRIVSSEALERWRVAAVGEHVSAAQAPRLHHRQRLSLHIERCPVGEACLVPFPYSVFGKMMLYGERGRPCAGVAARVHSRVVERGDDS